MSSVRGPTELLCHYSLLLMMRWHDAMIGLDWPHFGRISNRSLQTQVKTNRKSITKLSLSHHQHHSEFFSTKGAILKIVIIALKCFLFL
jgi:hypothetical protein